MRRVGLLLVVMVLAGILWWLGAPSAGWFGERGGSSGGVGDDSGPARELRISIDRSAEQAEAQHQAILRRYRGNDAALAWVSDCMARGGARLATPGEAESWQYACWRAWDEKQVSAESSE